MRRLTLIIGVIAVAIVVVLALVLVPRLLKPEQTSTQAYWPTQGWRTSAPEQQGFDSGKLAVELQTLENRNVGIDSLLIVRNDFLILDAYFYPYDNSIPHNLASVTKSVMTTLIGIAADQGKLQLDQAMVSFFPNRTIANLDDPKKSITIRHLASNMNGMKSGCLRGDEPTLNAMRSQPDWVQAALDRKMVKEPGISFCYDSPGMHLLSAILQEATGMTALAFARQYLFEPLGIQDAIWEADPQGYTHGWGDLRLKPLDAAKIGYLWLNGGVWEGNQIVSATWVEDAVKVHSQGEMDAYGYGWWVSDDSYYASGRGGQNIRVYPAYNTIIVTTASGLEYDQINPLLKAAFVDPTRPLPENPENVAKLDTVLRALAQPAEAWPTGALPDTARAISGKTYSIEPNAANLTTLTFKFDNTDEATLYLKLGGVDVTWPIGLDGKYRLSSDGQGMRGYWADQETFVIEIFDIGLSTIRFRFKDDRVEINSSERGLRLEGQIENP